MSVKEEMNNSALIPRPPSAVEKAEPGAKRVLAVMVADTLAIAERRLIRTAATPTQAELENWFQRGDKYSEDQDYEEAIKWFRAAAEQGHAKAQHYLGCCYEDGLGIRQDYAEAVRWYRKAADEGFELTQCWLGRCYYRGQGVAQDYMEAAMWFRKAAEQGYGCSDLALCYKLGRGVPQDCVEAYKWFKLGYDHLGTWGAAHGEWHVEQLKSLSSTMSPKQIAEGERRYKEFKATHNQA